MKIEDLKSEVLPSARIDKPLARALRKEIARVRKENRGKKVSAGAVIRDILSRALGVSP